MANKSPPRPQLIGSVTPSTAFAAMAASTALPPAFKISMAASVASGWLVAAMPFLPTAGGERDEPMPDGLFRGERVLGCGRRQNPDNHQGIREAHRVQECRIHICTS